MGAAPTSSPAAPSSSDVVTICLPDLHHGLDRHPHLVWIAPPAELVINKKILGLTSSSIVGVINMQKS
jgi:hypothetical protein